MTRINSIRMVLVIAALRNLEVHQIDVKTTFVNGELDEEIYVEQPEGFSAPGQRQKVCKVENPCMDKKKHRNNDMRNSTTL